MASAMIPGFTPRTRSILGPIGIGTSGQVLTSDGAGGTSWQAASSGVTDHGALTGLTDDDHTQYVYGAGRAGGQAVVGGTASGDDLTIKSNPTNDGTVTINDVEFGHHATGGTYLKSTRNSASADDWLIYCNGGTVFFRNSADTAYMGFAASQLAIGSSMGMRDGASFGLELASDRHIRFSSGTTYFGAKDSGVTRDAAGVVRTTDGSNAGYGDHKMAALRLVPYTTAGRPTAGVAGRQIYDTTLGKPIWDDGTEWRDAAGNVV